MAPNATLDVVDEAAVPAPLPPDRTPRRSRRRLWWVLSALAALVVLVVVAGALWFVFGREEATPVSADDALEQFRSRDTGVAAGEAGDGRPAAGVYTATASGTESIGLPGFDESFGPSAPVVVTHDDGGCFTYRADFNSHHWRSWTYCPSATATFALTGLESFTARKAPALDIESLTTYTCRQPLDVVWLDAAVGETRDGACSGTTDGDPAVTEDAAAIEVLDVGSMDVGGQSVDVVHVRTTDTFSGAQTGTEVGEWWLDATTGLPVMIQFDAGLKGGPSDYDERGTLQLSTLRAAR